MISFGRFSSSMVATLGLNPSRLEFLDRFGRELNASGRRFETLTSLGVHALDVAPTAAIEGVAAACERYFERNPYRRWFDQLEPLLQPVGTSFYAGTACHLDLVQWATDPAWGRLTNTQRRCLLGEDVKFLAQQLRHSSIRLLLLNGRAVINHFQAAFDCQLTQTAGVDRTSFCHGTVLGVQVIGWSTNIQSSFGVSNELRRRMAVRVQELAV